MTGLESVEEIAKTVPAKISLTSRTEHLAQRADSHASVGRAQSRVEQFFQLFAEQLRQQLLEPLAQQLLRLPTHKKEQAMFAKQILVPTDFSDCSKSALHLAVTLANGEKETSVIVLHVVEPAVPSYDDELGVLEPEALKTEFEVLAASRGHDVQIDAEICYGEPDVEILNFAKKESIDLIVMGTHGRTGLMDYLVGNTAENVMRKATCPVLTVRDDSIVPSEPTATEH